MWAADLAFGQRAAADVGTFFQYALENDSLAFAFVARTRLRGDRLSACNQRSSMQRAATRMQSSPESCSERLDTCNHRSSMQRASTVHAAGGNLHAATGDAHALTFRCMPTTRSGAGRPSTARADT